MHVNIQDMAKDDEVRVAFQALFLFVLRPYIPIKCEFHRYFARVKGFVVIRHVF